MMRERQCKGPEPNSHERFGRGTKVLGAAAPPRRTPDPALAAGRDGSELAAWPWPLGVPAGALAGDEARVWWASLRQSAERLADLAQTLSAEERERAARFRFPEHRDRFVAGRGLLRALLGAYLNRSAATLRFEQGPHGKPALAGADAESGLHFNLSHSGDGALYAVALREVGVDLESHDRTTDYLAILDRVCTRRERVSFQALPPHVQREAFFACWTRKEAVAKASGDGLAGGLRHLEVCFWENSLADDRSCLRDAEGREWSVLTLPLGSGWGGALAVAGTDWRWSGWRWRDALGMTS